MVCYIAQHLVTWKKKDSTLLPQDIAIIKIARNDLKYENHLTYKDSLGNVISKNKITSIDNFQLGKDYYVNRNGIVNEIVFRKINFKDILLEYHEIIKKSYNPFENFSFIEIKEEQIDSVLYKVYKSDQEVRSTGSTEEIRETDLRNKILVLSILKKYGYPKPKTFNINSVLAIFLTIQHGDSELRAYYYPELLNSALNEELSMRAIAVLEDRMLTDMGRNQVYGTQFSFIETLSIQDSSKVNDLRKSRDLDPLWW